MAGAPDSGPGPEPEPRLVPFPWPKWPSGAEPALPLAAAAAPEAPAAAAAKAAAGLLSVFICGSGGAGTPTGCVWTWRPGFCPCWYHAPLLALLLLLLAWTGSKSGSGSRGGGWLVLEMLELLAWLM